MKDNTGFTLIEIMISIAMLVAGFMAILYMFPLGAKIEKSSQMTTIALEIGQAKIEEINSMPYAEITSLNEDYGTINNFSAFKRVTTAEFYDPQTGGQAGLDNGIKRITVAVFWRSPLIGEENITLKTLISRK